MKKEVNASSFKLILTALIPWVLISCVPSIGSNPRTRDISNIVSGNANVALYQGRVLADNPIIISKNNDLPDTVNLNTLLSTVPITVNSFLKGSASCNGLEYCFEVREIKESPSALQTATGKWGYDASSVEFLQVNTFYHLNAVADLFFTNLSRSYDRAYFGTTPLYDSSLPKNIQSTTTPGVFNLVTAPLIAYANCDAADNAYFERTTQTLCLGYMSGHPAVKWAQDSTVIYHETGHFFQRLQLNLRNSLVGPRADMGNLSYDEAGSIGEGISDYYSYFVNGRTHFAEWAAGRFLNASRPMSERDPMHVASISTDPDQRLSYPTFLDYNPNDPTIQLEDIHYSGMIISHYLVALTEDLQDKCLMPKRDASDLVIHLVSETLAELGDLSSNGTQSVNTNNKINLNAVFSKDWFRLVNPINYRSFTQTFAKNLMNNLSNTILNPALNRCNSGVYTRDQIESLIDQYGLLLFRTYNENRNLSTLTGAKINTPVNATNRKKSVLISKNLLILDPTVNASSAYVIDNRVQIQTLVTTLQSGLLIGNLSPQTPSDFGFNNDNGKMSPGEVVAVALNIYNNSNTMMGGIQILANDWNHADASGKPCQFLASMSNDQWPLVSEGGVPCATTSATLPTDFAPVCFIQSNSTTATQWISQKDFQTKMALDSSFCLDPTKQNECFIRAIKGADQAHYSKINPKSTWGQTMADPTTGKATSLDGANIILFEVSKHIPPGTVVDCRLRLRFTNCEDCYHDPLRNNYDYTDIDYNGPRPFKIIHLQIPIID
jgi:hypothetical protein